MNKRQWKRLKGDNALSLSALGIRALSLKVYKPQPPGILHKRLSKKSNSKETMILVRNLDLFKFHVICRTLLLVSIFFDTRKT